MRATTAGTRNGQFPWEPVSVFAGGMTVCVKRPGEPVRINPPLPHSLASYVALNLERLVFHLNANREKNTLLYEVSQSRL